MKGGAPLPRHAARNLPFARSSCPASQLKMILQRLRQPKPPPASSEPWQAEEAPPAPARRDVASGDHLVEQRLVVSPRLDGPHKVAHRGRRDRPVEACSSEGAAPLFFNGGGARAFGERPPLPPLSCCSAMAAGKLPQLQAATPFSSSLRHVLSLSLCVHTPASSRAHMAHARRLGTSHAPSSAALPHLRRCAPACGHHPRMLIWAHLKRFWDLGLALTYDDAPQGLGVGAEH